MKVERNTPSRATSRAGAAAYAQRSASSAPVETPAATVTASFLGIPESELTPRVREAIVALMGEVDSLRRELHQAHHRLEEMEKTVDQDQLLPILNRRAFVRELTRHIAVAGRYNTPASLVYFDLNGFKELNDTHGHAAGDAALAHFADTILDNIRDSDSVGRLGGDEFGILLSHANLEQAHKKADLLAAKLKSSPIPWSGKSIPVSFAYGALELSAGDDAAVAMARADEAMYAHKSEIRKQKA